MWASLAPLANQQICHLQSERIYRIWKICRIGILEKIKTRIVVSSKFAITNQRNWELVSGRCAFKFTDFYWSWTPFWRHFGVLGHHFGTMLVTNGCKGALRTVLECPSTDFHRFLMIFGSPIGITLESLFHNLCDLRHQKACLDCRRDSSWLLMGKLAEFWCPNLSKT